MSDTRYRRSRVTGRFVKMTPDDLAPENVSAADVAPEMEVPRHAPDADELAQGDAYAPGARRAVLLHPDDAAFHNARLRSAARDSGPCDPTPYLVGLGQPETPATRPESAVGRYGDGIGTLSPRTSEDVMPGRGRPGGVRTISTADDLEALREDTASGLVANSEAGLYRRLRPGSHGAGRGRWREP